MFGTSGIRGIYGTEITEELAKGIGNIFTEKVLICGRDLRKSGIGLKEAVSSGVLEAGADFIDIGVVPTPTVALGTKIYNCRGIMITASHNPPEYNGLKLIEQGKEIGKKLEREIEKGFGKKKTVEEAGESYCDYEMVEQHKEMIISMVNKKLIEKKKPRVLVDCNGSACTITPFLLTELGCQVISVNASPECFNRPSEPTRENIDYLCKLTKEIGADFAVAHDGDGDRCVIVDDSGEMLPLDVQLAIMIEHELGKSKNKKIISTVEASLVIKEVVEENDGEIEITPVGSTYVGELLEKKNALFGGEPCGEYIYKDGVHVPDGILAAAKFVEIFCEKGKFSKIKKKYKQNFILRKKFPAEKKEEAIKKIKRELRIKGKKREDDGIRIDEKDGWVLVRASGTEPIIRLTMEYGTKERLEERRKELIEIIGNATEAKK